MFDVLSKAKEAKRASLRMISLTSYTKNRALIALAEAIWDERLTILEANRRDLDSTKELLERGEITSAIYNRLKLDESKILNITDMVKSVATLEDPVGKTEYSIELDAGFELYRVSSPIGVMGVIFESRPDALVQIASLCLKSGNSVLLKGGIEAKNSNQALFNVIKKATEGEGIPEGWVQLLEAREEVSKLLELDEHVDLIIPRGSNKFVKYIQDNTRIPVLGHAEGVCHIYVDEKADLEKAIEICIDAKVQYPAVCNAVDTILFHEEIAEQILPEIAYRLEECGVEMRGSSDTVRILENRIIRASDEDWRREYLDYKIGLKIVKSLDQAINHINNYGSHHTDAIITEDKYSAIKFMLGVDSASTVWNASTRFSDGYRYGLGAEVGISTGKIHARGPTGLEGLVIYKYHLIGTGQTVQDYVGEDAKKYTHTPLNKTWREFLKG